MYGFLMKLKSLIPLMIVALFLVGCTRSRPEPTAIVTPASGDTGSGQPQQPAQDGNPTTIAIQPTATPTSTPLSVGPGAGAVGGEGEAPTPTPPPETAPTSAPTVTPVQSMPGPGGGTSTYVIHVVQRGEKSVPHWPEI